MKMKAKTILEKMKVCREALDWCAGRTPRQAWEDCRRADWLLWLAGRLEIDRKLLVSAACECARRVLKYVPAGELRPLRAIEVAEAWCRGEARLDEVRAAAWASSEAARAAWAASRAAASEASSAASWAAFSAEASAAARAASSEAAWVASSAASAARAARASSAAVGAAASEAVKADIVRDHIPWSVIWAKLKEEK